MFFPEAKLDWAMNDWIPMDDDVWGI